MWKGPSRRLGRLGLGRTHPRIREFALQLLGSKTGFEPDVKACMTAVKRGAGELVRQCRPGTARCCCGCLQQQAGPPLSAALVDDGVGFAGGAGRDVDGC